MAIENYAIVDLHLHLDGSLSPEAIIEVAKKENIKLPSYEVIELKKYLEVPPTCSSLNEYLTKFDIPNLVLQSKYGLKTCTLDLLNRLSKDGLKYVEIRMAPQLSTLKGLNQDEVVSTLIETIKEGEKLYNIKANLILCLMRGENLNKENAETVKVARKYLNKGVVALDLAGAEALYPNEKFADFFIIANNLEIPFTIHAGEASDYTSVLSAIRFNAKRIGHGVRASENEEVINLLAERKIPLEICPKSNLDTKTISSISELPIKEFMEKGVIVTINTDDMTVSNTTLKNEYKLLFESGLNCSYLRQIAINSINSAFLEKNEKDKLLKYLESL